METAEHILFDCEAIALNGWQNFGRPILKPAELTYFAPRVVVSSFLVHNLNTKFKFLQFFLLVTIDRFRFWLQEAFVCLNAFLYCKYVNF